MKVRAEHVLWGGALVLGVLAAWGYVAPALEGVPVIGPAVAWVRGAVARGANG